MGILKRSLSVALVYLAAWPLLVSLPLATKAAPVACPKGETPAPIVPLATVYLPADLPAGSAVVVVRETIPPGEEISFPGALTTAYIVVSGVLEFQPPLHGGFHQEHPTLCQPKDGVYSDSGGVEGPNDDGWEQVKAGTTLVADEVVLQGIRNAGSEPLELILVTVRVPDIDPATGQPIGLQRSDNEKNERRQERRERKSEATPTP